MVELANFVTKGNNLRKLGLGSIIVSMFGIGGSTAYMFYENRSNPFEKYARQYVKLNNQKEDYGRFVTELGPIHDGDAIDNLIDFKEE